MGIKEKRDLGFLGALAGSLIGGICIILLRQAGVFSALSGVVLAWCTLRGHALMGGKPKTSGIIGCIAIMLAIPYLANRIGWALEIMDAYGWLFGDSFLYVHDVVADRSLQAAYFQDLIFVYAFTALGCFGILKQAFKKKAMED